MDRAYQPTDRARRWLLHINRHGPQSSVYLHALTTDTHRSMDTTRRQLLKLRETGYLTLPPQQKQTFRAEFNPLIYDITPKGIDHLRDHGFDTATIRPTGHWWHGFTVSAVSSAIDIEAARAGVRYIPAHEILKRTGSPLAISIDGAKLIPDQLFALDYGGSFRAFVLEVDRGTEPKTSPTRRKSWARSLLLYETAIKRDLPRQHYGLTASLLLLWVFTGKSDEEGFRRLVEERVPGVADRILTANIDDKSEHLTRRLPEGRCWNRMGADEAFSLWDTYPATSRRGSP
ncbi:MAG: replication-relaxation family protein [Paracoccus sp. (in: a-proteobacteria)]